jgi:hypothetical protein
VLEALRAMDIPTRRYLAPYANKRGPALFLTLATIAIPSMGVFRVEGSGARILQS